MPKPINPITFEDPVKNNEQKKYIILYNSLYDSDTEDLDRCKICMGRTEAFDFIKENIDDINLTNAIIITETRQKDSQTGNIKYFLIGYDDAMTVVNFCKFVQSSYGTDFAIEEYISGDNNQRGEVEVGTINREMLDLWNSAVSGRDSNLRLDIAKELYGEAEDV